MTAPQPTPGEIAAECERIRREWSDADELSRRVNKPPPWRIPRGSFAGRQPPTVESDDP